LTLAALDIVIVPAPTLITVILHPALAADAAANGVTVLIHSVEIAEMRFIPPHAFAAMELVVATTVCVAG